MKKGKIVATTLLALFGGAANLMPVSALQAERIRIPDSNSVRWEVDERLIVVDVEPNQDGIAMVYSDFGAGQRITNINIVREKVHGVGGDEHIAELGSDYPDWALTIYNEPVIGTAIFSNTFEQRFYDVTELSLIRNNPSGVIYYYAIVDYGASAPLYGKVDYSDCLNNPLYDPEDEFITCRLEVTEDGEGYYYPYSNEVRLEEHNEDEDEFEDGILSNNDENMDENSGDVEQNDDGDDEIEQNDLDENVQDKNNEDLVKTAEEKVDKVDNGENTDRAVLAPKTGEFTKNKKKNVVSKQGTTFFVISVFLSAIALILLMYKHKKKGYKE